MYPHFTCDEAVATMRLHFSRQTLNQPNKRLINQIKILLDCNATCILYGSEVELWQTSDDVTDVTDIYDAKLIALQRLS